jgi:hypothetical protein
VKFYHYTWTQNLVPISRAGLKPNNTLDKNEMWQTERPVVWLTQQQTNLATPADVEHYARLGVLETVVGAPLFGGPERATVHVERRDPKLIRYATSHPNS